MSFVIAIDGPAASGKGTLGRKLAHKYGFHHLDTGLLYRATARSLLKMGQSLEDEKLAAEAAANLDLSTFEPEELTTNEVSQAASKVAVMPEVRAALLSFQQEFSHQMPGVVLDGRDIGSVICPNADVKLFVTADARVRARRRFDQACKTDPDIQFETVLKDILERDERDQTRNQAPLKPSDDAHLIDTSEMDIEAAFQAVVDYIDMSREI